MVDTSDSNPAWKGMGEGRARLEMFHNEKTGEIVWMERLEAQTEWEMPHGGQEIFVLEGTLSLTSSEGVEGVEGVDSVNLAEGGWARHPASMAGKRYILKANPTTAPGTAAARTKFWVKSGHLVIPPSF